MAQPDRVPFLLLGLENGRDYSCGHFLLLELRSLAALPGDPILSLLSQAIANITILSNSLHPTRSPLRSASSQPLTFSSTRPRRPFRRWTPATSASLLLQTRPRSVYFASSPTGCTIITNIHTRPAHSASAPSHPSEPGAPPLPRSFTSAALAV